MQTLKMKKNDNTALIMKGMTFGIVIMLLIYGAVNLFTYNKPFSIDDTEYIKSITDHHQIYAFPIPEKIDFAGEKVPLENFDVREALDCEILKVAYWHSEVYLYLKRAHRYFPIIEKILKENNMPDDLKYFAVAESGLTNVVSPAGARGYWQFMKETAQEYGMEVTSEVDERYDLEKSTQAACEYFKKSYKKYNNWALAAASYNVGQSGIDKALKDQSSDNYYDLLLNTETGRYVYRTIALKLIMENPKEYGYIIRKQECYPQIPTNDVVVDSVNLDLYRFAQQNEITYKMLKFHNPWLRENKLTNKDRKKYTLRIPEKDSRTYNYYKDLMEEEKEQNIKPKSTE